MAPFSYKTIEFEVQGLYKEKGSKFHSFAYPVETEEDVKLKLDSLRKKYFDARHHCYAYRLGADGAKFRANDDGEPNHSAGDPILGQLRSKELTYTLIVVVRYFGGVKLGVGGLIAAYRIAAEEALNHAKIIQREVKSRLMLEFDYAATPDVMKLVNDFSMSIVSQNFQARCAIELEYALRFKGEIERRIKILSDRGIIFGVTNKADI
ncbi:MAG TPA: YigZ family protein [Chryseosolibacter sp.]